MPTALQEPTPVPSGHEVILKENRMFTPIFPLQLSFGFLVFFSFAEYLSSSLPAFAGEERLGSAICSY